MMSTTRLCILTFGWKRSSSISLSFPLPLLPIVVALHAMSVIQSQSPSSSVVSSLTEKPLLLLLVLLSILIASSALTYFRLSHIPGPFFAKFTNLQRFWWVLSYRAHEIHIEQHRKYGPLVRFGPNMVSVGDPKEIGTIYSFKEPWRKSSFYRALLMKARNKPVEGIFATQDEMIHRNLKRPISSVYSMSNLVSFEPYVDSTMRVFCGQLEKRFVSKDGRPPACNMSDWLQMFAFDVIGELTFSKRFGFLENGEDVDGIMVGLWNTFKKTSLVSS